MFVTPPPPPPAPTNVIIWVHGTNPEQFLPSPLAQLVKKTTSIFFHGHYGMTKSSHLDTQHYPFILTKVLSESCPTEFPLEHFYTFGWEGKLTLESRKKASYELFYALKLLILEYLTKDGRLPNLTLISHSHGGNVILHMADIEDPEGFTFHIKKAIFLACPVQEDTKHLIKHDMFERIYSIHSHTDMIQIADPQGLRAPKKAKKPLLSQRHFDSHPKLIQACIFWKNGPYWHPDDALINEYFLKRLTTAIKLLDKIKKHRGLFHVEFNLLPFVRHLPGLIAQLDEHIDNGHNCSSLSHDVIIQL